MKKLLTVATSVVLVVLFAFSTVACASQNASEMPIECYGEGKDICTIMPEQSTELSLENATVNISTVQENEYTIYESSYFNAAKVNFSYRIKNDTPNGITQKFAIKDGDLSNFSAVSDITVSVNDKKVQLNNRLTYCSEFDAIEQANKLSNVSRREAFTKVKRFTFLLERAFTAQRMFLNLPKDSASLRVMVNVDNYAVIVGNGNMGFDVSGSQGGFYVTVTLFRGEEGSFGSESPELLCVSEKDSKDVIIREIGSYESTFSEFASSYNEYGFSEQEWQNAFSDALENNFKPSGDRTARGSQNENFLQWREFTLDVPSGEEVTVDVSQVVYLRSGYYGRQSTINISVSGAELWGAVSPINAIITTDSTLWFNGKEMKKDGDVIELKFDYDDRIYKCYFVNDNYRPERIISLIAFLPLVVALPFLCGIVFLIVFFVKRNAKKKEADTVKECDAIRQSSSEKPDDKEDKE